MAADGGLAGAAVAALAARRVRQAARRRRDEVVAGPRRARSVAVRVGVGRRVEQGEERRRGRRRRDALDEVPLEAAEVERLRGRQDAADGVARARPDDVDLVPPAGADADAQRRPPERPVGPAHGPAVGDVEPRDDHEGRVGVQPERVVHRQREHDALLVLVAPREREVDARRVARGGERRGDRARPGRVAALVHHAGHGHGVPRRPQRLDHVPFDRFDLPELVRVGLVHVDASLFRVVAEPERVAPQRDDGLPPLRGAAWQQKGQQGQHKDRATSSPHASP